MNNEGHIYDLRFVSGTTRKPPCLTINIKEAGQQELIDRMTNFVQKLQSHAVSYLGNESAEFCFPSPDLFGNEQVGYDQCGEVLYENDTVTFSFPLTAAKLFATTLTLSVLFTTLAFPLTENQKSNRAQQVSISTVTDHDMHGHTTVGWLHSSVLSWIGTYAQTIREPDKPADAWNTVNAPPKIVDAMREVWEVLHEGEQNTFSSECRGFFRENGCFSLICFGNACDLSVYPDHVYAGIDGEVEFGCHNLDTAYQCITLLSGLAKLLELAEHP